MTQKQTPRRSAGFVSLLHIVFIIIIFGLISLCAWGIYHHQTDDSSVGSGTYKATKVTISLDVQADKHFDQHVYLTAYFDDSFDPKADCPARLPGFSGQLDVAYTNKYTAKLSVTQNTRPSEVDQSQKVSAGACPAVVVPAYSKKLELDKKWFESQESHIVSINGQDYRLFYDKQMYTLSWGKADTKPKSVFYPPDKVVALFSHRDSNNGTCMAESELRDYATRHNLALASEQYPGFEAAWRQSQLGVNDNDYYDPSLLVVANDGLKAVVQTEREDRDFNDCKPSVNSHFDISER